MMNGIDARAGLNRRQQNLAAALAAMIGGSGLGVPGLGVIVYKDGQPAYSGFFGRRYIDGRNPERDLPFTGDSRFRIASVSKQFTALSILQLAEKGKLSLDADVSLYLDFPLRNPAFPEMPITLRQLLSHTSSLQDGFVYAAPPQVSLAKLLAASQERDRGSGHFLAYPPGSYFQYSNLNYGLAGTIIEAVTGERFDRYQREHILKDLDISGSYHVGDFSEREMALVGTIYQKQKDGIWDEQGEWQPQIDDYGGLVQPADQIRICNPDQRWSDRLYSLADYKVGTNGTVFSPQGGLRISLWELAHVLEMYLNGGRYQGRPILCEAMLREMFGPQWRYDRQRSNGNTYGGTLENYGLGLYRLDHRGTSRPLPSGTQDLIGHTGEAYGLLSGLMFLPGTKDGFVYVMNGEAISEEDRRAQGVYSGNYRWQEKLMTVFLAYLT